jgi:hypothetical protein
VRDRKGASVTRRDPHRSLDLYTIEVDAMLDDGVPFDEIEGAIDSAPLPAEEKAALWLLAWSREAPESERPRAEPALRLVSSHQGPELGGAGPHD